MNKYREVECGGCAPPVQLRTDRNSEGAYQVEGSYRNMDGTFGHLFHAPTQLPDGTRVFTTPPASIPTAEVQALVERMDAFLRRPQACTAMDRKRLRDELAKLIPRGTP